MSNTWTDCNGVLAFDGSPKVTPVVETFFRPFGLRSVEGTWAKEEADAMFVQQCDEENPSGWEELADGLLRYCETHIYGPMGKLVPDDYQVPELILAIGEDCKADMGALGDLVERIDFATSALDLLDVFAVVRLINDGHNVKALRLMGGYHCDRNRLWEFGGFVHYGDAAVSLTLGTHRLLEMTRKLQAGDAEEAIGALVQDLLQSIGDDAVRARVADRIRGQAAVIAGANG